MVGRHGRPESPEALEAWFLYLAQGENRSYAAVATALAKSKSLIARWGAKHHWQDRIRDVEPRTMQPGEKRSSGSPPNHARLGTRQPGTAEADLLTAQLLHKSRSAHDELDHRLSEALRPILAPYLNDSLVPWRALLEAGEVDELSLATTTREAVAFLKPIVALCETDEPLWHDEVTEHLDALEDITRSSRMPLSDREEEAARGLLLRLAMAGAQFAAGILKQPQALKDMLALLDPFFRAVSHEQPTRPSARQHLRQLTSLMSLLPNAPADRQEVCEVLPR